MGEDVRESIAYRREVVRIRVVFLGKSEVQMVAVCDVEKAHRDQAKGSCD